MEHMLVWSCMGRRSFGRIIVEDKRLNDKTY
jgi:hypothetical protein